MHTAARETASVVVDLDWRKLDGSWWTEPGEYVVSVGRRADVTEHSFRVDRGGPV